MVTDNHYRWDFIMLSTDVKPTPATSKKVTNGSTLYTSDNSKLYVWYKDQWYEKTATGGGGGTTYTAGDGIDITDDTISVDTTTIQEKLTAGTGIDITDNTISAIGGGGGDIVELTSADYDYPTDNPDGIALWNLPNGFYKIGNTAYVKVYFGKGSAAAPMESTNLISDYLNITGDGTVDGYIYCRRFKGNYTIGSYTLEGISSVRIKKSDQVYDHSFTQGITLEVRDLVAASRLNDSISTVDTYRPLSAEAGKTLSQRLTVGRNSAPDSSTYAVVGSLYTTIESGTPHLYMCTAISTTGDTKTWVQLI